MTHEDDYIIMCSEKPMDHRLIGDPEIIAQRNDDHHKATIVIDIDETLLSARSIPIVVRPFAKQFLVSLRDNLTSYEVILWSAGHRIHVNNCLEILDPKGDIVHHAVHRSNVWLPDLKRARKKLKLLGRKNCIIIDDYSGAAVCNEYASIIVPKFEGDLESVNDETLRTILQILTRAHSREQCPGEGIVDFLKKHPFLVSTRFRFLYELPFNGLTINRCSLAPIAMLAKSMEYGCSGSSLESLMMSI